MGEFASAKWIIGIMIYFFVYFLLVFSIDRSSLEFQSDVGTDLGYDDIILSDDALSFQTRVSPFDTDGYCDTPHQGIKASFWAGPLGIRSLLGPAKSVGCEYSNAIDEASCNEIEGCTSVADVDWFGWFDDNVSYRCEGTINNTAYGGSDSTSLCRSPLLDSNESICNLIGCTWISYENIGTDVYSRDSSFTMRSIWDAIGFMGGFNAQYGIPGWVNFIFAFFFTYIPLFMLLLAVYFAIPFLH